MTKQAALTACVKRMKGLTGKGRDDAAAHFLAGCSAANPELFPPDNLPAKYVDVLEALAETSED